MQEWMKWLTGRGGAHLVVVLGVVAIVVASVAAVLVIALVAVEPDTVRVLHGPAVGR